MHTYSFAHLGGSKVCFVLSNPISHPKKICLWKVRLLVQTFEFSFSKQSTTLTTDILSTRNFEYDWCGESFETAHAAVLGCFAL
ncbi:hypothetical protein ACFX2K_034413 [Malus domestica]